MSELLDGFSRAVVRVDFPDERRVLTPRALGLHGSDFPFSTTVHIVTAYNPLGEIHDEAANRANHRRLREYTAALGVEVIPTVGSAPDGSIPEPGLLTKRLTRRTAVALGDEFGQSAIYEWSADRLEIVGVRHPGNLVLGWELEHHHSTPTADRRHPA